MRTIRLKLLEPDGTPFVAVIPGGDIEVLSIHDRPLFIIRANMDGSIEISSGGHCPDNAGRMLDTELSIKPESRRCITISRPEYK